MKKTLTILTILAVMLVAMMGSVFAASATVEPASTTKITAGQQIKVTVNSGEGKGVQYNFAYDSAKFTFKEQETRDANPAITAINTQTEGKLVVVALSTTQTLIFTAKVDVEVPAGEEAVTFPFTATDIHVAGTTERPTAEATLTVNPVPVEPTEEPSNDPTQKPGTTTPAGDNKGETDNKGTSTEGEEKIGTNGEAIKKLPQTGAPLYIGAIALVVVAGAVLAVRKIRK